MPLLKIFKRGLLYNTLTACWWMASAFVVGYYAHRMIAIADQLAEFASALVGRGSIRRRVSFRRHQNLAERVLDIELFCRPGLGFG